jgi:EmrB/QacA subfamily drug resistance transporter
MSTLAKSQARISQKVAVSVVYVAAMFMSIMDSSIVNVALPSIGRDFSVAPTSIDAISIAFLVSLAVFIPASGWLGDRLGGKRVLLAAIVVFSVASALCGAATSLGELVAFRVLQGVGGGMLAPVGMAMMFRAFPPEERLRASSIAVVPTAFAPALGPVVGGLLVTDASWRWVFYVNVPIGVAALLFGAIFVEHSRESHPGKFDLPGFLLSGIGLGLLMYGVSEGPDLGWSSTSVLPAIAVGAVLAVTMVFVELRTAEPIVALRLLGDRLLRATNGAIVMASIAFLGTLFAVTLYFQDGRGLTALNAGLSTFPVAAGVMAGAAVASRVIYWRLGPRRHITLGLIGVAAVIALLALLGASTSLWWARLLMLAMGFAMAQVFVPAQAAGFATISAAATGRASTLLNASRQLGGAIGVALLTTTLVLVGPTHQIAGRVVTNFTAYRITFLVAAAAALLGVISSLTINDAEAAQTMVDPRKAKRSSETPRPASASGSVKLGTAWKSNPNVKTSPLNVKTSFRGLHRVAGPARPAVPGILKYPLAMLHRLTNLHKLLARLLR